MSVVLNFIVVLGILIFFHEFGHFIVARLFGVGVEKFSLGFGPRIFGKTIGRTDYRLSAVPLGGYVKMVGEEPDAELAPEDLPYSFTHKHVAKRSLIVAAGPLFNVLLAILIFTTIFFFLGLPSIRPVVRAVDEGSAAQQAGIQAGDMIQTIDGQKIESWNDIDAIVDGNQGEPLEMTLARDGRTQSVSVRPKQMAAKDIVYGDDISYYDLGMRGYAEMQAVVGNTLPNQPAAKAGLQKGDRILAIDGQAIDSWRAMFDKISSSNGKTLAFHIARGDARLDLEITPEEVQDRNALGIKTSTYRIGIQAPDPILPEDRITIRVGPWGALVQGTARTWAVVKETGRFFVKLVERKVPSEAIGGPIRIAIMADQQAQEGFWYLLNFIAVISVSLAVINLVPIPVLDGGHLLFFAIEAIQRKPVNMRVRETAQQIGVFLLLLLMIFVFYNDIVITWFR
jgi:regulator of sigma E protease